MINDWTASHSYNGRNCAEEKRKRKEPKSSDAKTDIDYTHYLNSESDAAELHETVDLVKSQPVVVVVCR